MPSSRRDSPKQQRAIETREALLGGAGQVFTRLDYAEARLKDIAEASGMSEGTIYFHFGNKADIATAVQEVQRERMASAVDDALAAAESGMEMLRGVIRAISRLLASDPVVQGGVSLAGRRGPDSVEGAHDPWRDLTRSLLAAARRGAADGSLSAELDVVVAAEFATDLLAGAQARASAEDDWGSLEARAERSLPHLAAALGAEVPRGG